MDFPITDVLQMMGRAGRPQFDTEARAVVMVHEPLGRDGGVRKVHGGVKTGPSQRFPE